MSQKWGFGEDVGIEEGIGGEGGMKGRSVLVGIGGEGMA